MTRNRLSRSRDLTDRVGRRRPWTSWSEPESSIGRLQDVEALVDSYRTDDGLRYLDYRPLTPPGRMVPEDLAVTILINSRVAGTAFKAVQDHGDEVPWTRSRAVPSRTQTTANARPLRRHLHGHRVAGLRRLRRHQVPTTRSDRRLSRSSTTRRSSVPT